MNHWGLMSLIAMVVCLLIVNLVSCETDNENDEGDDDSDEDGQVWSDSETGLMWQVKTDCCYSRRESEEYCENLDYGGHKDWRLPSLDELRTLIRGCEGTVTGGACSVTGDCLAKDCHEYADCEQGCEGNAGPSPDGCYWPDEITENEDCGWYWSSSMVTKDDDYYWGVNFFYANIRNKFDALRSNGHTFENVRCVR